VDGNQANDPTRCLCLGSQQIRERHVLTEQGQGAYGKPPGRGHTVRRPACSERRREGAAVELASGESGQLGLEDKKGGTADQLRAPKDSPQKLALAKHRIFPFSILKSFQ
jgi:hypothetical protein